jgi:hypothetical protein
MFCHIPAAKPFVTYAPAPIVLTYMSDAVCVGRVSIRRFQMLSAGHSGHGMKSFAVTPEPPGITVHVGVARGGVTLDGGRVGVALAARVARVVGVKLGASVALPVGVSVLLVGGVVAVAAGAVTAAVGDPRPSRRARLIIFEAWARVAVPCGRK